MSENSVVILILWVYPELISTGMRIQACIFSIFISGYNVLRITITNENPAIVDARWTVYIVIYLHHSVRLKMLVRYFQILLTM